MQSLPSFLIAVSPHGGNSVRRMESNLRTNDPPVIGRIEKGRLLLDLRTVSENEEDALIAALLRATRAPSD